MAPLSHTHSLHIHAFTQPGSFDLREAPLCTCDVTTPTPFGCWTPNFSPHPSPRPSSPPDQQARVATPAMTSFHRWCHGGFALLKALYSLACPPPPSGPLPPLFPTARSLTPSSPTRLHSTALLSVKQRYVRLSLQKPAPPSPLLFSLRWFTWLMGPPFTHSLMLISPRPRSLLTHHMSSLVCLNWTSTHVFAV